MLQHYRTVPELLNKTVSPLYRCRNRQQLAETAEIIPTSIRHLCNLVTIIAVPRYG
jgi:hypothetical protein